ncbi:MAG: hypothetical protein MJ099_03080, partial [Clostridia bacterium]|nr:hypothetical protein [Clostridia bacterium]
LSVLSTVAACLFLVPEQNRAKLHKVLQVIGDIFTFRHLLLGMILRTLYIFMTIFTITAGFLLLFGVRIQHFYIGTFWGGLMTMVLGPIVLRILFEALSLRIMMLDELKQMNRRASAGGNSKMPARPARPRPAVCDDCGTRYDPREDSCPNCGSTYRR